MNNWKMFGLAVALPVLLLFSPVAMGEISSGGPEVDATKSLIVMIEDNLNGEPTQGAGIIFAVDGDWTYIGTAYHLVKRGDLRATALKIRFWQNQETYQAEIYDDKNICGCDLAVLRVKVPDATFEFRRLADPEQLRPSQLVHAIGHPNDEVPWNFIFLAGAISEIEPSYLNVQYPSIKEGDSGGPLVDEHGMIIGMVLGTDGTTVKVLRIDTIAEILSRDLHLTVELSPIPFSRFTVDDGSTSFRAVASNDPQHGNVWHSLAQTFTSHDEHVLFGFRLADASSSLPNAGTSVVYNLYAGENSYSKLLTSKTVNLPHTLSRNDPRSVYGDVGFMLTDFSDVDLTIGQPYTVEIKVRTFPSIGSSSPIRVWTSSKDPYHGGRFYFPPPTVSNSAYFTRDDMLFEVVHRGGMATYELNMRLSDGGSVRGYFKFDSDAAIAAPGAAGDRFKAGLVDYNIEVSGGNTSTFPELRYSPENSVNSVIGRDDGPGFPVLAFELSHKDAKSEGNSLAIRWTTPQVLPTKVGSEVRLTTWGWNAFGLSNQQCYDCYPQRQALTGFLRVRARKSGSNISEPASEAPGIPR
jgi:hypothetical protein